MTILNNGINKLITQSPCRRSIKRVLANSRGNGKDLSSMDPFELLEHLGLCFGFAELHLAKGTKVALKVSFDEFELVSGILCLLLPNGAANFSFFKRVELSCLLSHRQAAVMSSHLSRTNFMISAG